MSAPGSSGSGRKKGTRMVSRGLNSVPPPYYKGRMTPQRSGPNSSLLLCLIFLAASSAYSKTGSLSQSANGYYDTKILEDSGSTAAKKKAKKKKHKGRKKGSAKAADANSAPGAPQEEVTDQKEVSSQADQGSSKHKK